MEHPYNVLLVKMWFINLKSAVNFNFGIPDLKFIQQTLIISIKNVWLSIGITKLHLHKETRFLRETGFLGFLCVSPD